MGPLSSRCFFVNPLPLCRSVASLTIRCLCKSGAASRTSSSCLNIDQPGRPQVPVPGQVRCLSRAIPGPSRAGSLPCPRPSTWPGPVPVQGQALGPHRAGPYLGRACAYVFYFLFDGGLGQTLGKRLQNDLFCIPKALNIKDFDSRRERQCSAETLEKVQVNIEAFVKHFLLRAPKTLQIQDCDPPKGAPMLDGDFGKNTINCLG